MPGVGGKRPVSVCRSPDVCACICAHALVISGGARSNCGLVDLIYYQSQNNDIKNDINLLHELRN